MDCSFLLSHSIVWPSHSCSTTLDNRGSYVCTVPSSGPSISFSDLLCPLQPNTQIAYSVEYVTRTKRYTVAGAEICSFPRLNPVTGDPIETPCSGVPYPVGQSNPNCTVVSTDTAGCVALGVDGGNGGGGGGGVLPAEYASSNEILPRYYRMFVLQTSAAIRPLSSGWAVVSVALAIVTVAISSLFSSGSSSSL